jgi:hypothetical protein
MKKSYFRNSIFPVMLISLLVLSTVVFAPLVQADPNGVGKYVNVKVIGDGGSVTLIKVSSGESWEVAAGQEPRFEEKLGAGLVRVEVSSNVGENAVIDHWQIGFEVDENGDIINPETVDGTDFVEFRTTKGITYVEAYFTVAYTVSVKVSPDANNGVIIFDDEEYTEITRIVNGGADLDFEFDADPGYHISAIYILDSEGGEYSAPVESLQLLSIDDNYDILVFFSQDGYAYVPSGTNVATYFTEGASLRFDETSGTTELASGFSLVYPEGWAVFMWNIDTSATDEDGNVTIALEFTGEAPIAVYRSESAEALYCDVNNDGIVDAKDNSLVAIAIKTYAEGSNNGKIVDPLYDTNGDGDLTQEDLSLIHQYYGTTFDYLEFTIIGNIIEIETDHFSIFRGR